MESPSAHPIFQDTPTNQPYIDGAKLIYTRLKWDLRPESWKSRKRMRELKDAYVGKKAVIMCNGPSLRQVDLESLKGVYTFGLNQLHTLFEETDFRPSCMVLADLLAVEKAQHFLNNSTLPLFLTHKSIGMVPPRKGITYMHEVRTRKFARDLSISFYGGFSVTFVAMQLAYHMGFSQVGIVGCDHNFYRTGKDRLKPVDISQDREKFYFSPKYNQDMKTVMPASRHDIDYNFGIARDFFEESEREIYNCTVGGQLDVFTRMPLEDFLNKPVSI